MERGEDKLGALALHLTSYPSLPSLPIALIMYLSPNRAAHLTFMPGSGREEEEEEEGEEEEGGGGGGAGGGGGGGGGGVEKLSSLSANFRFQTKKTQTAAEWRTRHAELYVFYRLGDPRNQGGQCPAERKPYNIEVRTLTGQGPCLGNL